MKVSIQHRCADAGSYRAERVKSLFNVDSGAEFDLNADLPIDDGDWRIGVVVGPSGSGKTSIGRATAPLYSPAWPGELPIIDAIAPAGPFDDVPVALSAVGLRLFSAVLAELARGGTLPGQAQDEDLATWEPAFSGVRLADITG